MTPRSSSRAPRMRSVLRERIGHALVELLDEVLAGGLRAGHEALRGVVEAADRLIEPIEGMVDGLVEPVLDMEDARLEAGVDLVELRPDDGVDLIEHLADGALCAIDVVPEHRVEVADQMVTGVLDVADDRRRRGLDEATDGRTEDAADRATGGLDLVRDGLDRVPRVGPPRREAQREDERRARDRALHGSTVVPGLSVRDAFTEATSGASFRSTTACAAIRSASAEIVHSGLTPSDVGITDASAT